MHPFSAANAVCIIRFGAASLSQRAKWLFATAAITDKRPEHHIWLAGRVVIVFQEYRSKLKQTFILSIRIVIRASCLGINISIRPG